MSRTFAIRLSCPFGDNDSWVTLPNREESPEQILQQPWDFKCQEHGAQCEIPQEVIEVAPLSETPSSSAPPSYQAYVAPIPLDVSSQKTPRSSERIPLRVPVVIYGFTSKCGAFHEETETLTVNASGALVALTTKLDVGDTVFLIHKGSRDEQEVRVAYVGPLSEREVKVGLAFKRPLQGFWRKKRRRIRVPKTLRVLVKGTDSRGNPFVQTAYTVDLSKDGARLDGVGFLTSPGQTIEVRRRWRKANYRVIWIGQIGTSESNQVGLLGLDLDKNIWPIDLPEEEPPDFLPDPDAPKK